MKRFVVVLLLAAFGAGAVADVAFAKRKVVHRGPRRTVVVHKGWPLHRPARTVVVHRPGTVVRVTPSAYLPLVVWTGVVVASAPAADVLVWEDAETLEKNEGWTEFTLNADTRGTRVWLQVTRGRMQFDWAEVVFENGDAQVVDMKEWTRGEGLYDLLNFRDGRKVDHVRLVARARSNEARVSLKIEK
jgi:hypothetical protein